MSAVVQQLVVHTVRVPLRRPFVTAVRRATELEVCLVEARDADGRSGWGEAACSWRVTGESAGSVRAAVDGPLSEAVYGLGLDDWDRVDAAIVRALWGNAAARSAVDCALHDLAAQQAGQSLAAFLSPGVALSPEALRTDMTLSAAPTAELVEQALAHVADGFTSLKVKVGGGFDDLAALPALRSALGEGIALRADANQGWDVATAIATIRHWEDAGACLEFVEQPVAATQLEELAQIRRAVSTPLMADESVRITADIHRLVALNAVDLVNVKLAKSGGLSEARRMVTVAAEHGLSVMVGSMLESSVGLAAAAALALTLPALTLPGAGAAQDLDAATWLWNSPVTGGLLCEGTTLVPSARPGLGILGLASGDVESGDVVSVDLERSPRG
ncbi:mandelate racemase/muconate lactonizing enzyme family protein [Psychromicrobium xiongbiense]|uniref:mandelate racemase/muconate lactonizing enzyme family protein n=1 Tax=Psychromicrobium xiongbiense TaxID=3051184 RepID=UPI002552E059|nr:dipeptide epimerase [Psychromicrobium sp. YIM S02556]